MCVKIWGMFALLALGTVCGAGELRFNRMYSDHMVLQRDEPVKISGYAAPGAAVAVTLAQANAETTADAQGKWNAVLPAFPAGKDKFTVTAQSGAEKVQIVDVLFGDVWVITGQSNAWWPLSCSDNARQIIGDTWGQKDHLRLFRVARLSAEEPLDEVPFAYGWYPCYRDTSSFFSAIGYHFGRLLYDKTGIPQGLIAAAWPGPPISCFLPLCSGKGASERSRIALKAAIAKLQKGELPERTYGNAYCGMLNPLFAMPVKGVIFYQGEADSGSRTTAQYLADHQRLIGIFREKWGKPELPYFFMQLASHAKKGNDKNKFSNIREAQRLTEESVPGTHMACSIDIGEDRDIHPGNKQEQGRRLGRLALKYVYGDKTLIAEGPKFSRLEKNGNTAYVVYKDNPSPLIAKNKEINGFEAKDSSGAWQSVKALIDGNRVKLTADFPIAAVRYLWRNFPEPAAALYNQAGLPAEPFAAE